MHFDLTEDQEALCEGLRSLCEGRFDMARVRAGFDRSMWDELAETGVFSLLADGFGWADAALAFEELGRALVPGPLVWGVLAHGLAVGVAGGVELAGTAPDGTYMVEHLDAIDALFVLGADGINRVDPATLLDAEPLDWPLDPLTPVHRVRELPEGEPVAGPEVAVAWRHAGAVLTAAFLVGIAHAMVGRATEYAKVRHQFDRPIGSFQAIKHLLADALVRAEVARTAVHAAAVTLDDPSVGPLRRAVAGAALVARDAAITNAKTATQVHGGMGFTWEVDIHLYLKRAWLLSTVFDPSPASTDPLEPFATPAHAGATSRGWVANGPAPGGSGRFTVPGRPGRRQARPCAGRGG